MTEIKRLKHLSVCGANKNETISVRCFFERALYFESGQHVLDLACLERLSMGSLWEE